MIAGPSSSLVSILIAAAMAAASGLPALCLPRASVWGQRAAAAMLCAAALTGLAGAWSAMHSAPSPSLAFPWPAAADSVIGIDALSGFFLVPVFLMGGLGSVYGLGYWPQGRQAENGRMLTLFWGLLVAGMALLVISRHAMAFLLGWEVMAVAAFFLVGVEDHRPACRRAAWIYLLAAHLSTLTLFAMFALWRWATGSYALEPLDAGRTGPGVTSALFALALVGFGLKAGLVPLHFWLPGAHANAPSHVSAMLSGVVLKMGIYGLLRWLLLLPDPPAAWGALILALGAGSGLLGVVFALGQHDLKRLLAYHSVENIGIILIGLGVAMLGRSAERPEWIVLGLAGCLLHVWNHALFKSLLFLAAGSVDRATHCRQIDRLGGLAAPMPWTASLFLLGAVAICGLPPLNGFVSELFVYLGLLRAATSDGGGAAAMAAPVLAMIGALAVACFVKAYGAVFLGTPRTRTPTEAHESPVTMLAPMIVLGAACVLIGLAPAQVSPLLEGAIAGWGIEAASLPRLDGVAPLGAVSALSLSLVALAAALAGALLVRGGVPRRAGTWDCGYARPTSRMQYTASSLAQMLVTMFAWVLRPRLHRPRVAGLFPGPAEMHSHVDDPVLDRLLEPGARVAESWFRWFHRFQHGLTQHYVLYILLTVLVMLSTLLPAGGLLSEIFGR